MRIVSILIFIIFINSCSSEKILQRAINKTSKEYAIGYLQRKHPELFISVSDTLRDTVIINTVKIDSVLNIKELIDTIIIEKDRLKTKLWIKHDSIYIKGECSGDTIYVEKTIIKIKPQKRYLYYSYLVDSWYYIKIIIITIAIIFSFYFLKKIFHKYFN